MKYETFLKSIKYTCIVFILTLLTIQGLDYFDNNLTPEPEPVDTVVIIKHKGFTNDAVLVEFTIQYLVDREHIENVRNTKAFELHIRSITNNMMQLMDAETLFNTHGDVTKGLYVNYDSYGAKFREYSVSFLLTEGQEEVFMHKQMHFN